MIRKRLYRYFCALQLVGFGVIFAVIWLGEILDLPHTVFGGIATPINYIESLYESAIVIVLAVLVIGITRKLVNKIHVLEGMLAVCAHCKRIRVGDDWVPIESYVTLHSEAQFSHSFCPECLRLHYAEFVVDTQLTPK